MKTTVKLLSLVFIMGLFACSNEPLIEGPEASIATEQLLAKKSKAKTPSVPIMDYMNYIEGASSTIHRNKNGITVNFKTNGLISGNAYTLWFVVFDGPGPPYSTYAAGHIVGGSGKGNFSGHISVGDILDHPMDPEIKRVFNNPLTAEVHMALRTHGPAQPGMIPSQIHTMNGGCESGFPSGPSLHPDSDIKGYCANVQVGMHVVD